MSWKWLLAIPVMVLVLYSSFFTVDASEYVYLTQFGQLVAVLDGGDDSEAGPHWKWPWPIQEVRSLDRRLQSFDLPGAELLTSDLAGNTIDKTLTIDAYICWRISGSEGADQLIRTLGSMDEAQRILGQRVAAELGAAIATMALDDLVSTDASKVDRMREKLRQQLLRESVLESYGIQVVDIRLRRSNHPVAVREAIFDRIRSERAKKVAEYQSEGERVAAEIRSASEREVAQMKSDAEARAIELRGQAEAGADRIRLEAYRADPSFYTFLKKLEDYQRILGDGKTTLLLSTHREQFDLLHDPPKVAPANGKGGVRPQPLTGANKGEK
jgi:membrane protease subunit HflC